MNISLFESVQAFPNHKNLYLSVLLIIEGVGGGSLWGDGGGKSSFNHGWDEGSGGWGINLYSLILASVFAGTPWNQAK